jgi:hypothetical protein
MPVCTVDRHIYYYGVTQLGRNEAEGLADAHWRTTGPMGNSQAVQWFCETKAGFVKYSETIIYLI